MDGMGMMLKSLGIDPAKIMQDFQDLKTATQDKLTSIDGKLERIAKDNEEILLWIRQQPKPQPQLPAQPPAQPIAAQQPPAAQPLPKP